MSEQHLPGLCFNTNEWKNNHLYTTYLDSTAFKFNSSEAMKQISNQDLFRIMKLLFFKKRMGIFTTYLSLKLYLVTDRLVCIWKLTFVLKPSHGWRHVCKTFDSPERAEGKKKSGNLPVRICWCPPGVLPSLGGAPSPATLGSPRHLSQALELAAEPSPEDAGAPQSLMSSCNTYRLIIPDTAFQFISIRKLQGSFSIIPES